MLEKLAIRRCEVVQASRQVIPKSGSGDVFTALVNPAEIKHGHAINYSDDNGTRTRAIGDTDSEQVFASYAPETVGFTLILDSTGALPAAGGSPPQAVRKLVDKLKSVCYDYDSDAHEPNVVKLSWGQTFGNFFARLTSLTIDYTLFKSTGEPLRAKLQLAFVRFRTAAEAERSAGRQSPDMTRIIRVREGDTLPLLCERVYNDASRYLDVARANDLVNFRALVPNTLLRFPPLD